MARKGKLKASDIKVKSTPMLDRKIARSKIGKKFKMVHTRFFRQLMILNCTNPPSKKMTDAEIARQIRMEYSRIPDIVDKFSEEKNPQLSRTIAVMRSNYNRGTLIPSLGPPEAKYTSFPYNLKGQPVNPRHNTPQPLTPKQIADKKAKTAERRTAWEKKNKK